MRAPVPATMRPPTACPAGSDPLAGMLARAVQQRGRPAIGAVDGPVIQRWWAGIRQLSGLGFLGVPWDWGGNWLDLGLYHKHLFLEDGIDPADIGHMGPEGLGQDTAHAKSEYKKTQEGDDDATMRKAIARHDPAPPYALTDSNCQLWVSKVLATYGRLGGKLGRQQALEMSSF